LHEQNERSVTVKVHPFLEAYLNKGMFFSSIRHKWQRELKRKIKVEPAGSYQMMEYHFFNTSGEEILL
jgi:ribonuclease G